MAPRSSMMIMSRTSAISARSSVCSTRASFGAMPRCSLEMSRIVRSSIEVARARKSVLPRKSMLRQVVIAEEEEECEMAAPTLRLNKKRQRSIFVADSCLMPPPAPRGAMSGKSILKKTVSIDTKRKTVRVSVAGGHFLANELAMTVDPEAELCRKIRRLNF